VWAALLAATLLALVTAAPFQLGGIQVNEPDHAYWMRALKQTGMNTVAVTVYAKQGEWDGANLWWEDDEPAVVAEIERAKAHGLDVVLILRVALDHAFERNRHLWHGMIWPRTDASLEEWFRRYREFVDKWALIAERLDVDVLGVGSEMNALASTTQIDEVPNLAQWYLDETKQNAYAAELIRHGAGVERAHLRQVGANDDESLADYLAARRQTNRAWARTVTFATQPKLQANETKSSRGETKSRRGETRSPAAATEGPRSDAPRLLAMNRRRRILDACWRRVIEGARARYGGVLTYAANFDQYQEVGFWDLLDRVGINAYFQLRTELAPKDLDASLRRGWRAVLDDIATFRAAHHIDKPVMFTELGYTYRRSATLEPWRGGGFSVVGPMTARRMMLWRDEPVNYDERAAAVRALSAVRRKSDRLSGVLYWKLSTASEHHLVEPFVMVLSTTKNQDPMQAALRSLLEPPR